LCPDCASLIDKSGGKDFSVSLLHCWKKTSEKRARAELTAGSSSEIVWKTKLQFVCYLNVPRLSMLAGANGISVDIGELNSGYLHNLGFELNRVMLAFERVIKHVDILSLPLEKVLEANDDLIGLTVSFNERFRTKNGVDVPQRTSVPKAISTDWKKCPHIYHKLQSIKFVLPYDPRWVTTSTAFTQFRSGHAMFGGLATIKEVDTATKTIIASPMIMGLPQTPAMAMFDEAFKK
tara:strand:+ start:811 stop:1515 length:705 start_codon:yes stop_codon:yes gene_type:complete